MNAKIEMGLRMSMKKNTVCGWCGREIEWRGLPSNGATPMAGYDKSLCKPVCLSCISAGMRAAQGLLMPEGELYPQAS